MFKLESERLKREFKISNDNFYASQILNIYSDMSFVPDGNGTEFLVHFEDGTEFSAKGLPVIDSSDENGRLKFVFAENMGVTVTLEYWVHSDKKTICKQITLTQSNENIIDFVLLENMGIINSQTHLTVHRNEGTQIPHEWAVLGQPFYIDSLFFGCEFPAADSRIVYGTGRIKYYIGKAVGSDYKCPITVMGGAKDNSITEVKKAFGEYIDFISVKNKLTYSVNTWFDNMGKMSEADASAYFNKMNEALKSNNAPKISSYVLDDGWFCYKAKFWDFAKAFPNGFTNLANECKEMGGGLGVWLSPRGGYGKIKKLGKKFQKAGNGYYNEEAEEICVASKKYTEKLCDFMIEQTKEISISMWKLDGFASEACGHTNHDHLCGGKYDMYYISDLWHNWVELFKKFRSSGEEAKNAWINLTCFVNPSPWLLQWVNSIWIQNCDDIGFSDNSAEQRKLDSEITYRDTAYYDSFSERCIQLPLKYVFNHEPIYAKGADVNYTDEEFEKYVFWCAVRGAALNELYISPDMMNENKWKSLVKAMRFQQENFDILKNASFIGGKPDENNIYGFVSWSESEGIVALRNPSDEEAPLTITLNKLMGVPEELSGVKKINIYCKSMIQTEAEYSYNDKVNMTLQPYEAVIFKFAK